MHSGCGWAGAVVLWLGLTRGLLLLCGGVSSAAAAAAGSAAAWALCSPRGRRLVPAVFPPPPPPCRPCQHASCPRSRGWSSPFVVVVLVCFCGVFFGCRSSTGAYPRRTPPRNAPVPRSRGWAGAVVLLWLGLPRGLLLPFCGGASAAAAAAGSAAAWALCSPRGRRLVPAVFPPPPPPPRTSQRASGPRSRGWSSPFVVVVVVCFRGACVGCRSSAGACSRRTPPRNAPVPRSRGRLPLVCGCVSAADSAAERPRSSLPRLAAARLRVRIRGDVRRGTPPFLAPAVGLTLVCGCVPAADSAA